MVRGQKTKKQKGGHKLELIIRRGIKNPETYELLPHIEKLIEGVVSVEILSVSSKFSIVFKINVSEGASDFVDENEDPVTCFAIKLCFVNQYGHELVKPATPENVIDKHSISSAAFEIEKITQRGVWESSVAKGYAMVCPILTDGRILEEKKSRRIIDKLFSQDDPYKNYALSWLENGFAIGMYTMELIDPTLITFDQAGRNLVYLPSICASILVLMKCGVVHRDLHINNALINPDTHKSKIIDFGQVITMGALNADLTQYAHDNSKCGKIKQFRDTLMLLISLNLNTSERIMEALKKIVEMEREYNLFKGNFRTKDGILTRVPRNPLKYYYDAAVKESMGDRILREYKQIISSGVPQTPVKVGVRVFAPENVEATQRAKRLDPFGNYKFVPSSKKTNGPKGAFDYDKGTPVDESVVSDYDEGTPGDSNTPDYDSGTPIESKTRIVSETIGGTKRTRRKLTHTKRRVTRRKQRATRRRTRR